MAALPPSESEMPPFKKAKVVTLEHESTTLFRNEAVSDDKWSKLDGIVLRKSDKLTLY